MRKSKWLGLILPMVIIGYAVTLKKSTRHHKQSSQPQEYASSIEDLPPHVFMTSLADTLSPEIVKTFGIENAFGVKIYHDNTYSAYFNYKADTERVLKALALSPFRPTGKIADTLCRKVSDEEFMALRRDVSDDEFNATSFWSPTLDHEEVYECIKPPFKHTLVVSKDRATVKHRVEFVG